MNMLVYITSYKWNHVMLVLLHLPYFTEKLYPKFIHVVWIIIPILEPVTGLEVKVPTWDACIPYEIVGI